MPEKTPKQIRDKIVYILLLLVLTASVVLFVRSRLQVAAGVPYDLSALEAELMNSGLLEEAQPGSEASIRRNYDLLCSALRYENDLYLVSVTGHQASRLMEMIRARIER